MALQAIDGDANTKYLNFGVTNTGFIVTPATASAVQSLSYHGQRLPGPLSGVLSYLGYE